MEKEAWAIYGYADPWDADVQSVIRSSPITLKTNLFDQSCSYLSDCAMYVDFVAHRVYTELVEGDGHTVGIQHLLARYLDMFWPVIRDLRESIRTFRLEQMQHEHILKFAREFNEHWFARRRPSPLTVPSDELLHTHAEYTLRSSIVKIALSYDAPTPAQEDHAPLVTLFRKTWPQKHQIEQFVKKFIHVMGTVENRRVKPIHGSGEIIRIQTGDDVMRHVLQWWCLFHIGGYRHCQVVVTDPEIRELMCTLWQDIPRMTGTQLTSWCFSMVQQPVVTLCVINEFMIHTMQVNPHAHEWLLRRSKWGIFEELVIRYNDAYRKTLPYTPVPETVSVGAMEELDRNRRNRKKTEKQGREHKRAERLKKAALSAAHRQQTQEAESDSDVSGDDKDNDNEAPNGDSKISGEGGGNGENTMHFVRGKMVKVNLDDDRFRTGLYDEENDYEEKSEVLDEAYVRDMNKVTGNPALTQLHIFVRSIHDIGASTRVPSPFWKFVYEQMPIASVGSLDLKARTLVFRPSLYTPCKQAHLVDKLKLNIDTMMYQMTLDIDQQWLCSSDCVLFPATEHPSILKGIEPCLWPLFLGTRRVFQFTMMTYHCNPYAMDLVLWLIGLYYQHSRCGKPTLHEVFNILIDKYHYEYNVIYCMMLAWKEWSFAWRVPLPVAMTEHQITQIQRLFPRNVRPDFRIDWLLYCPSCSKVVSPIDQSVSSGSQFPRHYIAKSVAGFEGVFVDVRSATSNEVERPLYCPRKTGKSAADCAKHPLRYVKMLGYMCYLNGKCYVFCDQPSCVNKMQYNPEHDGYNEHGIMCSVCVESANIDRRNRAEIDAAVELERKSFLQVVSTSRSTIESQKWEQLQRSRLMMDRSLISKAEHDRRVKRIESAVRVQLGIVERRVQEFRSSIRRRYVTLPNGNRGYALAETGNVKSFVDSEIAEYGVEDVHATESKSAGRTVGVVLRKQRKHNTEVVTLNEALDFSGTEDRVPEPQASLHSVPEHMKRRVAQIGEEKLRRLNDLIELKQRTAAHLK